MEGAVLPGDGYDVLKVWRVGGCCRGEWRGEEGGGKIRAGF